MYNNNVCVCVTLCAHVSEHGYAKCDCVCVCLFEPLLHCPKTYILHLSCTKTNYDRSKE